MQILSLQNIKKEFHGEVLFENITFSMNENDRVALIGNNGCGKTTLLKMILKQEEVTSGIIVTQAKKRIGYLSQEVIENIENTLEEEILNVFCNLRKKEQELEKIVEEMNAHPQNMELVDRYSKELEIFTAEGGYDYPYKIEMMLNKFGFRKEDFKRKILSFSGGERTKIAFAKLLLSEPELLILDEPTNHLDLSTIEWLETYLKNYSGALLFVSHDRYFLDALANKILEIENKTSFSFKGNYEDFIEAKKNLYESQLKAYIQQQKQIERMKRFIEYYRYKPRFVSRVHDREKKLEHLKKIEKPFQENAAIKMHFQGENLKEKELLEVQQLSFGYQEPLIENISFHFFTKNRLAIMGENGSGKTTFLKILMEELEPLKGQLIFKRQIRIGYVDQHQLQIKGDQTILEYFLDLFPMLGEKKLRNHLGKFNFIGEDISKKLDILSGGEKMRLIFAKIILNEYDLLLLDEPTNHLDMMTRQSLIQALKEYGGAIIFVSHDRFFVDELATHLLYFAHGKSYYQEGCYQDFKEKEEEILNQKEEKKISPSSKEKKITSSPLKLEDKIREIEAEIKMLKEAEYLEENYMDYQKMRSLEKKIQEKEKELEKLENLYLR